MDIKAIFSRYFPELVVNLVLNFISNYISRNEKIIVFGAWLGERIADNPYYMYRKIESYDSFSDLELVWIYKSKTFEKYNSLPVKAYYFLSFKGIFYQLKCGACIVSHSIRQDLLWGAIGKRCIKVNLWHGSPVKKILKDVPDNLKKMIIRKCVSFFFPKWDPIYDLVSVPSNEVASKLSRAFGDRCKSIKIYGYPRVEYLLDSLSLANCVDGSEYRKVLYMPTLREGVDIEKVLFFDKKFDLKFLSRTLSENNIHLEIRVHPKNKLSEKFLSKVNECSNISVDTSNDIYNKLITTDCIVTDFSSIYIDFLCIQKPVIFTDFDNEKFMREQRELYYNYNTITWGPYPKDWIELVGCITFSLDHGLSEAQLRVNEMFNVNHEDASRNIIDFIMKCLKKNV